MSSEHYQYKPLATPWRVLLIVVGTISLIVGIAGLFLPLLPTTEFILLTAFCYARSSERLHRWVVTRPYLQASFAAAQRFQTQREIPLRVKVLAIGMSWFSVLLMASGKLSAPHWAKWTAALVALVCTVFMLKIKTARN